MKLMLDAGHGGYDPGAVFGNHEEEDTTLDIVLRMHELCKELYPEWDIIITRSADIYLSPGARQRLMLKLAPKAFVSIHCNSAAVPQANGAEVIYRDDLDLGLATQIQRAMVEDLDVRDRGVKNDLTDLRRQLSVLSTPAIPSVIVEPGFISNDKDRLMLLDTDAVARAILRGISNWVIAEGVV